MWKIIEMKRIMEDFILTKSMAMVQNLLKGRARGEFGRMFYLFLKTKNNERTRKNVLLQRRKSDH